MKNGVRLRLLGPIEAVEGERPLRLGGPRQRALLALLALEPGRPVGASRLAEELWEGAPPPGAETTLRSYLSRLRRALGRDAIVARAGGYVLQVDPGDIDVHRFESLVTQGRAALGRGAPSQAALLLADALALWRGPALAGIGRGGALAREAARLDDLRLAALEERFEADIALGRHEAVVSELQALAHEHPLRERLWRQAALALYRCGRQADALAAIRRARTELDALGIEPSDELRDLERSVLRQAVPSAASEPRPALPVPLTPFVGRERELGEVRALLGARRLVTLTGLGGTGKTRLALEVVSREPAVRLADLTAVADASLVVSVVAEAAGAEADALFEQLARRELLLVLDNCEHVADACGSLAGTLLARCPNVRVLATSRIALGVAGEAEYVVEPLDHGEAVSLFLDRAASVRRDIGPSQTVDEICRELDGLPLAIELAAARAKALALDEIAARLDDRLRFLRAWRHVADPRHETVQATIDWSYDLLEPEAQRLFRRLAVFRGGATLGAVAAVCLDGDRDAAADGVERLVDVSLVRPVAEATRYRMLETVRQYAAAKLDEPELPRLHARYFLALAESANLSFDALGRGEQRLEVAVAEQHDLRAALDWAAENDPELGLRLALALENFWATHAPEEWQRRLGQLLAAAPSVEGRLRAAAVRDYGASFDAMNRPDDAAPLYAQSRALFSALGDAVGVANLDFRLGVVAALRGEPDEAKRLWETALEAFEAHHDLVGQIQAFGNLGEIALEAGDFERGAMLTRRGIELARTIGWHWWVAQTGRTLAEHLLDRGEADEAEEHAYALLDYAERTSSGQDVLLALALLARVAAARGDDERALALWSAVEATEDAPGRFGRFDRAAYAAAMPDGKRAAPLPVESAVALARAT